MFPSLFQSLSLSLVIIPITFLFHISCGKLPAYCLCALFHPSLWAELLLQGAAWYQQEPTRSLETSRTARSFGLWAEPASRDFTLKVASQFVGGHLPQRMVLNLSSWGAAPMRSAIWALLVQHSQVLSGKGLDCSWATTFWRPIL